MSNATRITVATFGTLAALAGIEHGVGELVQGSHAPGAIVIAAWPDSPFFRIVSGEPAMTIVPNLLLTGILAISVSLIFLVWATKYVQRTHGGPILLLLSVVLLGETPHWYHGAAFVLIVAGIVVSSRSSAQR